MSAIPQNEVHWETTRDGWLVGYHDGDEFLRLNVRGVNPTAAKSRAVRKLILTAYNVGWFRGEKYGIETARAGVLKALGLRMPGPGPE